MTRSWLAIVIVTGSLIAGFSEPTRTPAPTTSAATPLLRRDWEASVRQAASSYASWGRVSDRAHWAPTDCRIPARAGMLHSESTDADTHGGKLYFLFAAQDQAYPRPIPGIAVEDQPVGQVVVKEAFAAQLCTDMDVSAAEDRAKSMPADTFGQRKQLPDEYAQRQEGQALRTYKAGEPAGLFVMFKTEPSPETDKGWVYATVKPNGIITSLGRVESCMECHVHAKYDRLFGPTYARTLSVTR